MKLIGIIGGIGSGKSTASQFFRELGAAVIDADIIGHQVLRLPQVKQTAQKRWGTEIFADNGEIDRRKLAAVVFAKPEELTYLKSITHPLIAEEVCRQRSEHKRNGVNLCLLDAPLLLEAGWESLVDLILFVSTPQSVRRHRIQDRNWPATEWQQRESAQFSADEKLRRSDIILDNTGNADHLRRQIKTIAAELMKENKSSNT